MAISGDVGDRILWTAVIVTGIAACWFVPYFLNVAKKSAAVDSIKTKPPEPRLQDDAEASLKLSTLQELANGPNYNITAATLRLINARFLADWNARRGLLQDLGSKEWHRRDRAIQAFRFLLTNPALKESDLGQQFLDITTYQAFIIALQNLISEHEYDDKPFTSPIRPPRRPTHEAQILNLLAVLMDDHNLRWDRSFVARHIQPAIDAGIITDWLTHYPFPCATKDDTIPANFTRSDVSYLLDDGVWGTDDPAMSKLVMTLLKAPNAARQLMEVGLRNPKSSQKLDSDLNRGAARGRTYSDYLRHLSEPPSSSDVDTEELIDGEILSEMSQLMRPESAQRRGLDRPAGEVSRQRRHRQAVVVAEAGAPLRPENILQRQPTETEVSWQQQQSSESLNLTD